MFDGVVSSDHQRVERDKAVRVQDLYAAGRILQSAGSIRLGLKAGAFRARSHGWQVLHPCIMNGYLVGQVFGSLGHSFLCGWLCADECVLSVRCP